MTWNYRVMRRSGYYEEGVDHYGIYEVYYDDGGEVSGWTEQPMEPSGKSLNEINSNMLYMKKALNRPVLDYVTGKEIE